MVGPKNRVKSCVGSRIALIFPQTFAAFRLRWCEEFRRGNAPDRADVHVHDPAGLWVIAYVELARAALGRGVVRCVEILVTRYARRGRVRSAESWDAARAARARRQFGGHMHGLASGSEGDNDDCVCLGPIMKWANRSYLGIVAAGRLIVSGLATVCLGAIVRMAVGAWGLIDVEVIIGRAAAAVGPTKSDFDRRVRIAGVKTGWQTHRERKIITRLR